MHFSVKTPIFRLLICTLLLCASAFARATAADAQQTPFIFITMSPASPFVIAPNTQQGFSFTASHDEFEIEYLTSLTVSRGDGDCFGFCPFVAAQDPNITGNFNPGPLSIAASIAMPDLPPGVSVARTFYYTVTARGFYEGGIIPRFEAAPQGAQLIRTRISYFTVVVSGNGPVPPTATQPPPPTATQPPPPTATQPPPPTATQPPPPTATQPPPPTATQPPPPPTATQVPPPTGTPIVPPTATVGTAPATATPAGPTPTPPSLPATSTPGTTPPTATVVATVPITPFVVKSRMFLPLSVRFAGSEREPNNATDSAQQIAIGSVVQGALNDERDVYVLTVPVTAPIKLSVEGNLQSLAPRVQLQLFKPDASPVLFNTTSQMPLRLEMAALSPGTYYVIIYTDPRFLAAAVNYELSVRAGTN
jgi:hypothetical protein